MSFLFTCLIASYTTLTAVIIEIEHFGEIVNYVKPNTLIILDIDDTILIPTQTLGTDVWFLYRLKQYELSGLDHPQALEKALAEWEAIRHLTNVQLVEEGTDKVIEQLQSKEDVMIMGLTTQGLALATRTILQLQSLNVDLTKNSPCKEDCYFINKRGVLFRHGLLFTAATHKGAALIKFLDIVDFHPEHIIFINDKATHVHEMEESVVSRAIDFIGLRYAYSDQRVANFRKDIAEIQWLFSTFDHLLSDQEAEEILKLEISEEAFSR